MHECDLRAVAPLEWLLPKPAESFRTQLVGGPADRLHRHRQPARRTGPQHLVCVAADAGPAALPDGVDAFGRPGAVQRQVAAVHDQVRPQPLEVVEHRLQREQVAVHIGHDRDHRYKPRGRIGRAPAPEPKSAPKTVPPPALG